MVDDGEIISFINNNNALISHVFCWLGRVSSRGEGGGYEGITIFHNYKLVLYYFNLILFYLQIPSLGTEHPTDPKLPPNL